MRRFAATLQLERRSNGKLRRASWLNAQDDGRSVTGLLGGDCPYTLCVLGPDLLLHSLHLLSAPLPPLLRIPVLSHCRLDPISLFEDRDQCAYSGARLRWENCESHHAWTDFLFTSTRFREHFH